MNLPLSGWKSYLAAAGFVLVAGYYAYHGQQERAVEMFLLALSVAGLRSAIASGRRSGKQNQ